MENRERIAVLTSLKTNGKPISASGFPTQNNTETLLKSGT